MIKRGDISAGMLVGTILLVLGFVIVLFFYFQLSSTERVDREVCHQSVIFRGTLPAMGGAKDFVPLKCKSQKICITSGLIGGKCSEFENSKGVIYYKVKNENDIAKVISQEIVDCWEMMGEGKLGVFTEGLAQTYGIGNIGSSCVVCSRIAFDRASLGRINVDLKKVYIQDYMKTHSVPGKNISYFQYLAGQQGLISVKDNVKVNDIKVNDKNEIIVGGKQIDANLQSPTVGEPGELGVIFMQVSAPTRWGVVRNTAITAGIGFGSVYAIAPKIVTNIANKAFFNIYGLGVLAILLGAQQASVTVNQDIAAGYCGDVSVGDSAREGCSVVRAMDYNLADMQNYCSTIESIA